MTEYRQSQIAAEAAHDLPSYDYREVIGDIMNARAHERLGAGWVFGGAFEAEDGSIKGRFFQTHDFSGNELPDDQARFLIADVDEDFPIYTPFQEEEKVSLRRPRVQPPEPRPGQVDPESGYIKPARFDKEMFANFLGADSWKDVPSLRAYAQEARDMLRNGARMTKEGTKNAAEMTAELCDLANDKLHHFGNKLNLNMPERPVRTTVAGFVLAGTIATSLQASPGKNELAQKNVPAELSVVRTDNHTVVTVPGLSNESQDPEKSRKDVAESLGIDSSEIIITGDELRLPPKISADKIVIAATVAVAPDGDEEYTTSTTSPPEMTSTTTVQNQEAKPEVKTSPEITRLNEALSKIDMYAEKIDLTELIQAVTDAYAAYRPHDKDRPDFAPEGYVKLMLPHEAEGIAVPFSVAERTADIERYGSPATVATFYAAAKVYQDIIAIKYPQYEGQMLRVRDLNSPVHNNHNFGIFIDFSSSMGPEVKQYADGSFGDFQFSAAFDKQLNIDVLTVVSRFMDEEGHLVDYIVFSGQTLVPEVNNAVGRKLMLKRNHHNEHYHLAIVERWALPNMPLRAGRDLPWGADQDLRIGDQAVPITDEQRASQHADYEAWLAEQAADQPEAEVPAAIVPHEQAQPVPEVAVGLTPDAEFLIDELALSSEEKAFMKRLLPAVVHAVDNGAPVNPEVVFSQACLETAFGNDNLSRRAKNYFGIKAGSSWQGETISLPTKEVVNGQTVTVEAKFRAYGSVEESIDDYAHGVIGSKSWFRDAVAFRHDPQKYMDGLFEALDENGNVDPAKSEPSYATDPKYRQKIQAFMNANNVGELVNAQRQQIAPNEPTEIVLTGDSLTHGLDINGIEDMDSIHGAEVIAIDAVGGRSLAGDRDDNGMKSIQRLIDDGSIQKADVVSIFYGTNKLEDDATFEESLRAAVAQIREVSNAKIVMPRLFSDVKHKDARNQIIQRVAEETGAVVIDPGQDIPRAGDNIHLGPDGYKIMADRILEMAVEIGPQPSKQEITNQAPAASSQPTTTAVAIASQEAGSEGSDQSRTQEIIPGVTYVGRDSALKIYAPFFNDEESLKEWVDSLPRVSEKNRETYEININNLPKVENGGSK